MFPPIRMRRSLVCPSLRYDDEERASFCALPPSLPRSLAPLRKSKFFFRMVEVEEGVRAEREREKERESECILPPVIQEKERDRAELM